MKVIYKYPLKLIPKQTIELPKYYGILGVKNQHEEIVLYAMIDPDVSETKDITIHIYGTGHSIDNSNILAYLGTVAQNRGQLMWHVFIENKDLYAKE